MKELKHLKPAFNLDLPKYRDLRELLNGSAARYPKNNAAGVVSYTYDSDGMEGTIYCAVKNDIGYVGIDLPVRLYLIDNSRFQLMMFYDFKTLFKEKQHFWNYSVGGIMFGVRL